METLKYDFINITTINRVKSKSEILKEIGNVPYCQHCKSTEKRLIKTTRKKLLKTKEIKQYYVCAECNAERSRNYYKTSEGNKKIREAVKRYELKNKEKIANYYKQHNLKKKLESNTKPSSEKRPPRACDNY